MTAPILRNPRGGPLLSVREHIRARRAVARAQRAMAELTHDAPLHIHIGAGPARLPGWIDTDIQGAPYHLDLLEPWPGLAGRVHRVFGDNVIEHFRLPQVRIVLRNLLDALEPGGVVRLITPDIRGSAEAYLEGGEPLKAMLERHRRAGYEIEHDVDVLRVLFHESGHDTGYLFDEASLRIELERAGFVDVTETPAGEPVDPAFEGLENRTSDSDRRLLLALEARRPLG